jgi:hypothetical protein
VRNSPANGATFERTQLPDCELGPACCFCRWLVGQKPNPARAGLGLSRSWPPSQSSAIGYWLFAKRRAYADHLAEHGSNPARDTREVERFLARRGFRIGSPGRKTTRWAKLTVRYSAKIQRNTGGFRRDRRVLLAEPAPIANLKGFASGSPGHGLSCQLKFGKFFCL